MKRIRNRNTHHWDLLFLGSDTIDLSKKVTWGEDLKKIFKKRNLDVLYNLYRAFVSRKDFEAVKMLSLMCNVL